MGKREYLQELRGRLSNRMPARELESTVHYYEEYFEEAGTEKEDDVIEELGTPAELTAKIMGDRPRAHTAVEEPPEEREERAAPGPISVGALALVLCLSPIWGTLLAVAFSVVVALVIVMFSVAFALAAAGIGCVAGGLAAIVIGFSALFSPGIPTVILFCGGGLLAAGIGFFLLLGTVALGALCVKGTVKLWTGFFRGIGSCWRRAVYRRGGGIEA